MREEVVRPSGGGLWLAALLPIFSVGVAVLHAIICLALGAHSPYRRLSSSCPPIDVNDLATGTERHALRRPVGHRFKAGAAAP